MMEQKAKYVCRVMDPDLVQHLCRTMSHISGAGAAADGKLSQTGEKGKEGEGGKETSLYGVVVPPVLFHLSQSASHIGDPFVPFQPDCPFFNLTFV